MVFVDTLLEKLDQILNNLTFITCNKSPFIFYPRIFDMRGSPRGPLPWILVNVRHRHASLYAMMG